MESSLIVMKAEQAFAPVEEGGKPKLIAALNASCAKGWAPLGVTSVGGQIVVVLLRDSKPIEKASGVDQQAPGLDGAEGVIIDADGQPVLRGQP
jgi:hypothetical protein